MQYICKIDINKLGHFKENVITREIIITNERIKHIQERHPGIYEMYSNYIQDIIKYPDYILEDTKNKDTIIILKKIAELGNNVQLVIKLSTGKDIRRDKNSILTLWKIRNSTYKQLVRNKKILYKKE